MAAHADLVFYFLDLSRKGKSPAEAGQRMARKFKGENPADLKRAMDAGLAIVSNSNQITSGQYSGSLGGLNPPKLGPGNRYKWSAVVSASTDLGSVVWQTVSGEASFETLIDAIFRLIHALIGMVDDSPKRQQLHQMTGEFKVAFMAVWKG